jgi:hypothetical protein
VGEIARLLDEARRKNEREQREWDAQRERWRQQEELQRRHEEQRRIDEANRQSQEHLRRIISDWEESKKIEAFFVEVENGSRQLPDDLRERVSERVRRARALLSNADVLERFSEWKLPEERLNRDES